MFRITSEPIPGTEPQYDPAAGGHCVFVGTVRNHHEGRDVERLEYEAYQLLAEKEGGKILAEAVQRFGLIEADCVHRTGSLLPGELAIRVSASSAHRDEAFQACRYIVDEVKSRVPIWKKEFFADGDSGWVRCDHCCKASHAHDHAEPHLHEGKSRSEPLMLPEIRLADQSYEEPEAAHGGVGVMLGLVGLVPLMVLGAAVLDRSRVVFPDWMRDHLIAWLSGILLITLVLHRFLVARYVTGDWPWWRLNEFYRIDAAYRHLSYASQRRLYQERLRSQPINRT